MTATSNSSLAAAPGYREYVAHGYSICGLDRGRKGPGYDDWNVPEKALTEEEAEGVDGAGILHAYSGTSAIDVDDKARAVPWFANHGIDLEELLRDPASVQIVGRPSRAKLIYRLRHPLRTIKPKESGVEFRCATSEGLSVQDCLPPTIHPDTHKPYAWFYPEPLIGHWSNPPPIPAKLLALWRELAAETPVDKAAKATPRAAVPLATVRKAVYQKIKREKLDIANHDDWLKIGMALHDQTGGTREGLELWDEISAKDDSMRDDGTPRYQGIEAMKARWDSFSSTPGKNVVTLMADIAQVPANKEEFDIEPASDSAPVRPIPKAQHLCSDQANAERLQKRYGDRLIACAGAFYTWDVKRWKTDDGLAQRFACDLSNIVKSEIATLQERVAVAQRAIPEAELQAHIEHPRLNPLDKTENGREFMQLTLEALEKWSVRCEMKATQDAALGLLRKLLAVDAKALDADPWLFNCENGTIDLRTGELREHRASDYLTKLAPVHYDPQAKARRFEDFLGQIFADNIDVIMFMQRWYGYCATGNTREQCLVIHWGGGSNGKSTLINAVVSVLGDYATTAPTGLLTAKNSDNRHPSEIAKLHGARLVTASESEDGAKLREAHVKDITGGDMLTARKMYGEWFDFLPTHKLQLLTNHKPQIRGSDHGIWRRLLLVPYAVKFGTADELTAGAVAGLKDRTLGEALEKEKVGILNWIVEGAHCWYADGLQPPGIVLEANRSYREEQDRLGEFIRDCCQVDRGAKQALAALYRAYTDWCREAGIEYPLTRQRFGDELEQRGFQRARSHGGTRCIKGIAVDLPA